MRGYLFIADITGYTAYLSESELDHARSILEDLLNLLLKEIHPPLQVSKLEGDAVLAYTSDSRAFTGQTLVDMVERMYATFRRALELMNVNTECPCQACKNIPNLDLKFFVHHGEFARQSIGTFTELVGTDVNLIHRLTKNSVQDATGWNAYALYTAAALEAVRLDPATAGFTSHAETYDHIGEVQCFVQDMTSVWERRRKEDRLRVTREESIFILEQELPVPIAIAWDYITRPETRALISDSDSAEVRSLSQGRIGEGSEYLCAHGDSVSVHTILDWEPLDYYTYRFEILGGVVLCTVALEDRGDTTHVVYTCRATATPLKRFIINFFGRILARRGLERGLASLQVRIEADLESGALEPPAQKDILAADLIRNAATAALPTFTPAPPAGD